MGLLFAIFFPTFAAWLYFVALHGQTWIPLAYGLSKVVQFAFPVLWVALVLRESLWPAAPTRRGLLLGALFGLAVMGGMLWLYHAKLMGRPELADTSAKLWSKLAGVGINTSAEFLLLAVFLAGLHSFLEEYYWRWFVFGQLRKRLPVWAAIVISSLAFALHHVVLLSQYLRPEHFWTATLALSLCVAIGGAFWAWLYHRSGSLYGPWLSHCLADVGLMWIGYDLCRSHFAS